jgi:hypothetical protein
MKPEELERWLASDDAIVPSSGFVASVMDAVRSDAQTPAIPFPWRRMLPGLVALAIVVLVTAVSLAAPGAVPSSASLGPAVELAGALVRPERGWLVLTVLATAAPLLVFWRVTRDWH